MILRTRNYRNQRTVRFPRKKGRLLPVFLRLAFFCLTVWVIYTAMGYFFNGNAADAPSPVHNQTGEGVSAVAVPPATISSTQSTSPNNAQIVAQAAQAYRQQNSVLSVPLPAPSSLLPAGHEQAAAITPQSPHLLNPPSLNDATPPTASQVSRATTRLHNGVSWNIPYVGYKLEEIATSIQHKHPHLRPGKLVFQPEGVLSFLPTSQTLPAKSICLTINGCGPFEGGQLLDLLKKENIPTAFFLSSVWIVKHKKEFSQIEKEPLFTIEGHGKKHIPLSLKGEQVRGVKGTDSLLGILQETEGNLRDIQRLTNKRPRWFRAAFSMYDNNVMLAISKELKLPLAGYSLDANGSSSKEIIDKLMKAKHGDIIMLRFSEEQLLYDALAEALPGLKAQGFTFVPLPSAGTS